MLAKAIKSVVFVTIFVGLTWILISVEAFDWMYESTRVHEDWDLDEIIVGGLAALICGLLWLAIEVHQQRVAIRAKADALKESEKRFKEIAEVSSDWFWEQDSEQLFTYHSPRYFEITGFLPENKIGTRRKHFVDAIDVDKEAEKWAAHEEDLKDRRPFKNFEYAFQTYSGRIIHVRVSGVPLFDAEGNFLGYRGTGTDITKIKLADEEKKALIDAIKNLQEGIAFFSPDEKLIFCNSEYLRLGFAITHLFVPGASFESLLKANVESGEILEANGREEEYIRERLDSFRNPKEPFTRQLANGTFFLIKEGKSLNGGTYSTSMDITTLKHAEEALSEEKRKFAGGSQ